MSKINATQERRTVTKLLLQMKPESKKEEYAKKAAIASMFLARSTYDSQIQMYMQEHHITKEDLKARVEYWENKLKGVR
ncbi:MAG: hypothetical protein H3Z54_11425 [archaeon]|nr:hypothetical protein [archaeon]